ncbi:MAG: amidohydrolase family protein [Pseudomonadota bacterium]
MTSSDSKPIGFVGCDGAGHGHQQADDSGRREVRIDGRRITTVDVHAHCVIPKALEIVDRDNNFDLLEVDDLTTRFAAMDAQGIDIEVLSINPFWYEAPREEAAAVIDVQNEALAEFCAREDRFASFATAALQFPDLAVAQIEAAARNGFRGVGVGGSVAGRELADPAFDPVWRRCEELDLLVFLHPQGTAGLEASGRLQGNGMLSNTIGNPLETTIALSHLIFEGTLDRYPGLKICAAHGGGYLPSYANRSDAVLRTFPKRAGPPPAKPPTAYLRDGQLFFDTIVFTTEALRHLIAETGSAQVMMGTDYPFPWTSTEVDLILATPGLSDAEREAILGGTAARLLGIESRARA